MTQVDEWDGQRGELTLQDYLSIFQRRRWTMLAILVIALVGAGVWNVVQSPTYESVASVLLRTNNNEQLFPAVPNSLRSEFTRRADAELDFANATVFQREAEAASPAGASVEPRIDEDDNQPGSLEFVSRASDPLIAQQGAAGWARTYIDRRLETARDRLDVAVLDIEVQVTELEGEKAELQAPLQPIEDALQSETDPDTISRLTTQRLSLNEAIEDDLLPITIQLRELNQSLARLSISAGILDRAGVSEMLSTEAPLGVKVAPSVVRNMLLAGALGILAAAGAALLAETLTSSIRNGADLERVAPTIPVLAQLPELPKDRTSHQMAFESGSGYAEATERLLSALLFQRVGRPGDRMRVLVTSALPGDGKTTVVANLARRLALTRVNAVFLDADLRRPKLHAELGVQRSVGLSEVLRKGASLERYLHPLWSTSNLRFITAGQSTDRAATILRERFGPAIDQLPLDYDLMIVDAPPVLAVTDAEVLVDAVDAALLVVRAHRTKSAEVTQAIRQLSALGSPIAGMVLVGVRDADAPAYGYGYGSGTADGPRAADPSPTVPDTAHAQTVAPSAAPKKQASAAPDPAGTARAPKAGRPISNGAKAPSPPHAAPSEPAAKKQPMPAAPAKAPAQKRQPTRPKGPAPASPAPKAKGPSNKTPSKKTAGNKAPSKKTPTNKTAGNKTPSAGSGSSGNSAPSKKPGS
ncbi:MAG: P-loop NTPase [Actinomycetota bacterium]